MPDLKRIKDRVAAALEGEQLTAEDAVDLLACEPATPEAEIIWHAAREVALKHSRQGRIWAAIGVDYRPCPRNCRFCSFGAAWRIVTQSEEWSIQQVISAADKFARGGADWITIRTTQDYPHEHICTIARALRAEIADCPKLVINTGEFTLDQAHELYAAGYRVAYHVYRLREGRDTGIDPAARLATLENIRRSPLELAFLVEPVGVEHTVEEIATEMIRARRFGATLTGVMARVPVPGTPLGDLPPVPEERLAHMVAVSRLVAGYTATDICVHPPSELALQAGANVVVVETGAVPRERDAVPREWRGLTIEQAREMLARHYSMVPAG